VVHTQGHWDKDKQQYTLKVKQSCPATAGSASKEPFQFPLVLGLVNKKGDDLLPEQTLVVKKAEQSFVIDNVIEEVIPSINRHFSAPIKLHTDLSEEDLYFLFAHDNDPFNQFEAGQELAGKALEQLVSAYQNKKTLSVNKKLIDAMGQILSNDQLDPSFRAEALSLPSVTSLLENMEVCDFEAATEARHFLKQEIAKNLRSTFETLYADMTDTGAYQINATAFGRRSLKGLCLGYLMTLDDDASQALCLQQYQQSNNMTDEIVALGLLCDSDSSQRGSALQSFYDKWKDDALVMNKWFAVQAVSTRESTLEEVKALESNPAFDDKNPNKVRSLIGGFAIGNLRRFHDISGAGYSYIADKIIDIDSFNPSIASGLAGAFKKLAKCDSQRQKLMSQELNRILQKEDLSKDVFEIVSKTLKSAELATKA